MLNSMITSSVTMGQLQQKMDTIANNIANINTAGFKRKEVSFNDLLYQQIDNQPKPEKEVGRLTPNGIRQGVGAALGQAALRMNQGSIQTTGRALDIAITNANQFFKVSRNGETPSFTREGKFYLSPDANGSGTVSLVTASGDYVQGKKGNIVLPADAKEVIITKTGEIRVQRNNGDTVAVDQLDMVNVTRPQLLNAIGDNKFKLPDNLQQLNLTEGDLIQTTNVGEISIQQGALEMSNVSLDKEMSELMMAQKSYQFNAQSLRMANDMFGLVNQLR